MAETGVWSEGCISGYLILYIYIIYIYIYYRHLKLECLRNRRVVRSEYGRVGRVRGERYVLFSSDGYIIYILIIIIIYSSTCSSNVAETGVWSEVSTVGWDACEERATCFSRDG